MTHILDDHHKEGQLNTKRLLGVGRACDIVCADVRAGNFQHRELHIRVCDALDMAILYYTRGRFISFRGAKRDRSEVSGGIWICQAGLHWFIKPITARSAHAW